MAKGAEAYECLNWSCLKRLEEGDEAIFEVDGDTGNIIAVYCSERCVRVREREDAHNMARQIIVTR